MYFIKTLTHLQLLSYIPARTGTSLYGGQYARTRALSTAASTLTPISRRAMLYVPGSNPRMLDKSLSSPADSIAYDLEDSVAPGKKADARRLVCELLDGDRRPKGEVVARINAVGTGYEQDDLDEVLRTRHLSAIALPKTTIPEHLAYVISRINALAPAERRSGGKNPIRIIGMIENARGMMSLKEIIESGKGHLDALLFAAEDYCADVGLTRTPTRTELLFPRSQLVTAAKAYGLQAIDLVCVEYKDLDALRIESEEGRRLGFDGKQAIHPNQVEQIHRSFAPDDKDILRAARIKTSFELHDSRGTGAYSLDGVMIDAPMYKQAIKTLSKAEAAGLAIPSINEDDL